MLRLSSNNKLLFRPVANGLYKDLSLGIEITPLPSLREEIKHILQVTKHQLLRVYCPHLRRLREINEHRPLSEVEYVERREIAMHEPTLCQLPHIFEDLIEERAGLLRIGILELERDSLLIADELHDKHVVLEGERERDANLGLASREEVAILALAPGKYH